jgi:hypothetical protein
MQTYLLLFSFGNFQDLLSAVEGRTALEREVKLYQERLLASQRAWDASKQELTQLRKRCQELDVSLKASREATTASQSRNSCFREKLTALLCSRFDTAESTEDAILERIRELGIEEESQRRVSRPWPFANALSRRSAYSAAIGIS